MIAAENTKQPGGQAGPLTASAEAGMAGTDAFGRMDPRVIGVASFIASEAVFFAILILTYIFYRNAPAVASGPNAHTALADITRTAIFTVCLLASSGTIWMADRSLARGSDGGVRIWLGVTILLGGTFLVGQALEYASLIRDDVTIDRNVFGTTFFTLTGFHGLHVFVGLVALLILFGLALSGQFKGRRHNGAMAGVSLYWHFVDVVWIFVFSVVYLWNLIG